MRIECPFLPMLLFFQMYLQAGLGTEEAMKSILHKLIKMLTKE